MTFIVINLPGSIDLPPEVLADQRNLRDGLAALLYKQGRIGSAMASEMMGLSRREFESRVADFGYAMMDVPDLERELAALDKLVTKPDDAR